MLNIELYKAGGTKFFVKIYTLTLLIFMLHLNNGKCIELSAVKSYFIMVASVDLARPDCSRVHDSCNW